MITHRQFDASLPVELAHVLPEHGAGDAVDERVHDGVYNVHSFQMKHKGNAHAVQPEWQPTHNKDDGDYKQQRHIFVG